jgi:type IV pilus assembly protein PilQ
LNIKTVCHLSFALIFYIFLAAPSPSPAETRQFRLNYIDADAEVLSMVHEYLDAGGRAVIVNGSNSIVATDSPAAIMRVSDLIAVLDQRPLQVLIESRIVEVLRSESLELGINWSGNYSELSGDILGRPGIEGGSFAVNQPFEVEGGGTLGYGFVTDRYSLSTRLSALEQRGSARTISSPRVVVIENRRAVISQGEEFVVPKREQSTYINTESPDPTNKPQPETYSAVLKLAVVPRVVEGSQVSLALEVRREEFDHIRNIEGFPLKRLRSAMTELLVKSGSTAVIGGIRTEGFTKTDSGVPLLSRIPILGWLFKGRQKTDGDTELMIFLTPTVLTEISAPSALRDSTAL